MNARASRLYACAGETEKKKTVLRARQNKKTGDYVNTTFHFPEIMINNITGDVHDSEAMCPEYKVVAVRIRKSKGKYKQVLT